MRGALLHLNEEVMNGISEEEQNRMYQILLKMEENLKKMRERKEKGYEA